MNKTHKKLLGLFAGVLLVVFLIGAEKFANAAFTKDEPTNSFRLTNYQFFASTTAQTSSSSLIGAVATSTSATSTQITAYTDSFGNVDKGYFVVRGARKVEFYFTRGATSTNLGISRFYVQGSPNGSDWYDFGKLEIASSSAQTLQPYVSINAATSTIVTGLNLDYDSLYAVRCIAVITSDGQNSCAATAEW